MDTLIGSSWDATSTTGARMHVRVVEVESDGRVTFRGDLDGTLPFERFRRQFRPATAPDAPRDA